MLTYVCITTNFVTYQVVQDVSAVCHVLPVNVIITIDFASVVG